MGPGLLRRCYGSVKKLVGSRRGRRDPDVEAAVTGENSPSDGIGPEPAAELIRVRSHRTQSKDKHSDVSGLGSPDATADRDDRSPSHFALAALTRRSNPSPHLLSDEENARMNSRIDRLIAAIDDRRPIHFASGNATSEVAIFADRHHGVIDQDEAEELEYNIELSPENFGRIMRPGNGVCRTRSPYSLRYASSTDSWASTDSEKPSSNAQERALAAANIRLALGHGRLDQVATVIRRSFGSPRPENARCHGRRPVRTVSPIPLDFNKPLRTSTPSIHSNGSEQDTSSPLFGKSCERMRWGMYAQPPESLFRRESSENSQLDEWESVSEPCDVPSPADMELVAPSTIRRAFGVFQDEPISESPSKKIENLALRSKALKDVSNLRRPGYLQFNSFAKDTKPAKDRTDTSVPAAAFSIRFGGASDSASRRAYISKKWPGLLKDRGNSSMVELPRPDGTARRRNEQAIGSPVDRSLYALSHTRTSVADTSLNVDPARQAHFDLALARLEGRALPPPPSPISRHPDWATLFDRDVQIEGGHRPLPFHGPRPKRSGKPTPSRELWRYFR